MEVQRSTRGEYAVLPAYLPSQAALKLTATQSCPFPTGQMDKANELCIPCGIAERLSASLSTH